MVLFNAATVSLVCYYRLTPCWFVTRIPVEMKSSSPYPGIYADAPGTSSKSKPSRKWHVCRKERNDGITHGGWAEREPVSYTHLRAHETRHDLVCRLLLEKKKNK